MVLATAQRLAKTSTLHRMVMPDHVCPFGIRAKDLLERQGFAVEDVHLTTRAETEAFKAQHNVQTTPQIWIADERVGGYDDLRAYFGKRVRGPGEPTYRPVIAIFAMAALLAVASSWYAVGSPLIVRTFEWFIAFAMCLLALQKLQDVERFATMFLNYDLLAQRWPRYGYLYPFGEGLAGVLMVAGALTWVSAPLALLIGSIGAVSVFKAVYIDRRTLKCACVGGDSNVPLGFVSLTENVMMVLVGGWMLARAIL